MIQRRRIPARDPLHHLLELFDAVTEKKPELKTHREAVKTLEVLRTTWITQSINRWPIEKKDLVGTVHGCNEIIGQLQPNPEVRS